MPEPVSVPDQLTGIAACPPEEAIVAGSAATALVGDVTSMVFNQVGVLMAALLSKTTDAVFATCVPVLSELRGMTLKSTLPCPTIPSVSGGRKPTVGSVGGRPVEGSIEVKVQVARPVDMFSDALIWTERLE